MVCQLLSTQDGRPSMIRLPQWTSIRSLSAEQAQPAMGTCRMRIIPLCQRCDVHLDVDLMSLQLCADFAAVSQEHKIKLNVIDGP